MDGKFLQTTFGVARAGAKRATSFSGEKLGRGRPRHSSEALQKRLCKRNTSSSGLVRPTSCPDRDRSWGRSWPPVRRHRLPSVATERTCRTTDCRRQWQRNGVELAPLATTQAAMSGLIHRPIHASWPKTSSSDPSGMQEHEAQRVRLHRSARSRRRQAGGTAICCAGRRCSTSKVSDKMRLVW